MRFTGEYCIPGKVPKRIEDDHLERYKFAAGWVKGKTVLDIACGVGYGSKLLADAGAVSVDGVDISAEVLEYAKQHYAADNVRFLQGDVQDFKGDKTYKVIVCFETIEHIQNYQSALRNLYSLLDSGGTLVISSPNRLVASPMAKSKTDRANFCIFHVNEFSIAELQSALQDAGFVLNKGDVFGQRQQWFIRNEYLRRLYRKLFRPDETTSPIVTPVRKPPRYFVLVARKPGQSVV